ncbi:hypothetical protein [Alkalilimnicola sp. S0819]|uniref:hypothetical protein n=1 Tax=Alkalilimnicola sp. S0819 TaxID=2613922 RepID=UPI0012620934|nr:hypothetical protein [Alkalilimnicola sp. S0819]KAB7624413.1 hypothetical protein F3N43_06300 [Alkalilimnicola sp. S0819]MPQ16243.1 hypothetical protein [Alkalilimnicola sp. S0819]
MTKRGSNADVRMRERLAQEAARVMAEEGVGDFAAAKRKAALRLGAPDTRNLPRNQEVQAALMEYQRLFQAESQPRRLRQLREAALEAMALLAPFRPALVGSVLSGTASEHSDVNLHLFAETPEDVAFFLMDRQIPFETDERKLRYGVDQWRDWPVIRFLAGDVMIDLTIFDPAGGREPPRSRVDGRPMERAGESAVRDLLAEA